LVIFVNVHIFTNFEFSYTEGYSPYIHSLLSRYGKSQSLPNQPHHLKLLSASCPILTSRPHRNTLQKVGEILRACMSDPHQPSSSVFRPLHKASQYSDTYISLC
jgi:hypothetical protein